MGVICCIKKEQQDYQEPFTKSLSDLNTLFQNIKIEISNECLNKQSLDMVVIFADQTLELKGVSFINKLIHNQIYIIKQLAKNLANQHSQFSYKSEEKQNLLPQQKEDKSQQEKSQQWKIFLLDNPIQRLDISSFLFVNMKIWDGTDKVTKLLQQLFEKIRLKIDKIQTIGFIEVPAQLGIPIQKFHQILLQTILIITKNQNKKSSFLISNQKNILDSLDINIQHNRKQNYEKNKKKSQDQLNKLKLINQNQIKNNIKTGHKLNKLVYLSNSKKSIAIFSQNLKNFKGQNQNSFLNQSDYY